ncbi:MAG: MFS transporter [Hyphomicrobiaceae bacterium]|nr:MFS transporter [Hyphomicrobiaceae bacterium]
MSHTHVIPEQPVDGDKRAKRNALILSFAQALYYISATIQVATTGLVGHVLAEDKSLATLPVTAFIIGSLITTIPASMFMREVGRRAGFQLGAVTGALSAALATYAIYDRSFWLFCFAIFLSGAYQAFAQYYRFAAADTASEAFRPRAISWVLAGGLIAAVAGPQLVIYTKDALAPVTFAGVYVASAAASLLAIGILSLIDIPKAPKLAADGTPPRPLREILKQPRLRIAIFSGMVSYGSMTFLMTATPLAMVACNHSVDSAAWAIQWHVLAMFAPSFVTGRLIDRFGRERVVLAGLLLLAGAGVVAHAGISLWHFNLAMILLGVGWNLGYIGSTTMVTDCHRPEERNKVQAVNEFMVFGLLAFASFFSGKLLHDTGWETVTISYLPFVVLASGLVFLLSLRSTRWGAAPNSP